MMNSHLVSSTLLEKTDGFRCTGGISQATLCPDGTLKICNAAADDRFQFLYNVFDKGLAYSWINCGKNVLPFRNEKKKATKDCKQCSKLKECQLTDCRVLAYAYTGAADRSNPLTCYLTNEMPLIPNMTEKKKR